MIKLACATNQNRHTNRFFDSIH